MLRLEGLDGPTWLLEMWIFFFLISQSVTEQNSCGFILVGSCNVLSNIGFRDFSIVAPAFYEFMVIELKKSWQKAGCGRGEAVNLSSYFVFPIFSPRIQW